MTEDEVLGEGANRVIWKERLRAATAWLPLALLVGVALCQYALVFSNGLVIWKGGGFGMFSTIEGVTLRRVEVYNRESDGIEVPSTVSWAERRASVHPSRSNMLSLAQQIDVEFEEDGTPERVGSVRVYGTRFEGEPLRPVRYLVRKFDVPVE